MESHGKMVRPNGQEIVGFNMNFYNLRKKNIFYLFNVILRIKLL
jgi:hypothetical protein